MTRRWEESSGCSASSSWWDWPPVWRHCDCGIRPPARPRPSTVCWSPPAPSWPSATPLSLPNAGCRHRPTWSTSSLPPCGSADSSAWWWCCTTGSGRHAGRERWVEPTRSRVVSEVAVARRAATSPGGITAVLERPRTAVDGRRSETIEGRQCSRRHHRAGRPVLDHGRRLDRLGPGGGNAAGHRRGRLGRQPLRDRLRADLVGQDRPGRPADHRRRLQPVPSRPWLSSAAAGSTPDGLAAGWRRLRATVRLEAIGAVAILGVTAVLANGVPANGATPARRCRSPARCPSTVVTSPSASPPIRPW